MTDLPDLPLVKDDFTATALLLDRWRQAVINRTTVRPLPSRLAVTDRSGYPTREFQGLWRMVFGGPVPTEPCFTADGKPTHYLRDLWPAST